MKKYLLLIFLSAFFLTELSSQTVTGMHVRKQGWKVVEGPFSNVIYPLGLDSQAIAITNNITYLNTEKNRSVGTKTKKLNLILNNRLAVSNGFVGFFPYRSEFFTVPYQNIAALGTVNWLDLLSIHEYRHAMQNANSLHGLSKLGYWLGGENFWIYLSRVSLPNWYYEGDAVIQETALTEQGRGRNPSFSVDQRAIANEGLTYRYHKIRNGSFKDLVPDHYRWGYTMLTHLRNEKGNDIPGKILKDGSSYKHVFYPYSRAMKSNSGFTTKTLYKESWEASKQVWDERLKSKELIETNALTETDLKTVTHYHFPKSNSNGELYASYDSYKETSFIAKVSNGEIHKIVNQGNNIDFFFDVHKNKFVWTEYRLNGRRSNETFNDIVVYDQESKKRNRISKKGKFYSPIFSADGQKLFALEVGLDLVFSIVEMDLDGENKKVIKRLDASEFPARLTHIEEKGLAFIIKKDHQVAIWSIDLNSKEMKQLSPWTHHNIDAPFYHDNSVYFSSSFNQIDNIYSVAIDGSQTVKQLSSVPLGAYDPSLSADGSTLYFTEKIFNGNKVSSMPKEKWLNKTINIVEPVNQQWRDKVAAEAEGGNIFNNVPAAEVTIKDYKSPFKGLNIYSWSISPDQVEPTLELLASNYLMDFHVTGSVGYNTNEESSLYLAQVDYARHFPVLSAVAGQRYRETDILGIDDSLINQSYIETMFGGEITIPLAWNLSNYNAVFNTTAFYNHIVTSNRKIDDNKIDNFDFGLIGGNILASFKRRTAAQNIDSKFGIQLGLSYFDAVEEKYDNEKIVAETRLFLPGLSKNHTLQIRGAYQKEPLTNGYQLSDNFQYSRGFKAPVVDEFRLVSFNYGLPFVYPDWGFWGLSYFKRIRLNAFFDYGEGDFNRTNSIHYYSSVGGELIFDNVLGNLLNLSFGIRGSSLLTDDPEEPDNDFVPGFFVAGSF